MAKIRAALYCSSSIENFKDKLKRRFELEEWHFLKSMFIPAIFFGMYNPVDYFRFLWHQGDKTIFWCGGDILNLEQRRFWQIILNFDKATHICENIVEFGVLRRMGIIAKIQPCLVDKMDDIEISYKHSENPQVYLTAHQKRQIEYGVDVIERIANLTPDITYHIYGVTKEMWFFPNDMQAFNVSQQKNIIYHGKISNEQFTKEIENYQAAIRLNGFDGFSEILAKSILMGQYPISCIKYPFMDYVQNDLELVSCLNSLKEKYEPNLEGREYWLKELNKKLI